MAQLPSFRSYGEYASQGYGAHCLRFDMPGITIWFSYSTPVAFHGPGGKRTVRQNNWGPTTGKHLNWIDGGDKASRLPSDAFEAALAAALES